MDTLLLAYRKAPNNSPVRTTNNDTIIQTNLMRAIRTSNSQRSLGRLLFADCLRFHEVAMPTIIPTEIRSFDHLHASFGGSMTTSIIPLKAHHRHPGQLFPGSSQASTPRERHLVVLAQSAINLLYKGEDNLD